MSSKSGDKSLDISIMGRTYKVNCADEERDALLEAVGYLDQKMNEIKSAGRVGSVERIAVMAALNIAHELLVARDAPAAGERGANAHDASNGFDMEDAKRRMRSMQAALENALAPQENLFK